MPVTRDVPRTRKTLSEAQKVLQNAHDYIELCGFDIDTALADGSVITDSYLKDVRSGKITDVQAGSACFIGSARLGAGVRPDDFYRLGTDGGDGPELTIALEYMDAAVPEEYREEAEEEDERNPESRSGENDAQDGPGGVAEAYGFIIQRSSWSEDGEDEVAEAASELFKTALRNIYNDLQNL